MLIIKRRKWLRYSIQFLASFGIVALAWLVVNTQRSLILETYSLLTRPLYKEPSLESPHSVNLRVEELKAQVTELKAQNKQLKTLLKYTENRPEKTILAPVIARSPDQWWDQVILGRGQTAGIKTGYIVTGTGGLVGRIIEVTPNTSRVLLISNPTSTIGGIINRSRSMGIIKGKNNAQAVIQFFEKVPSVKKGDLVMTSSVSQLFPSGYLIGKIKSLQPSQGPAPEAIIQLTASVSSLEWVLVHPFAPL